ncbi:MAG TPA: YitT family protein [Clostridiales bacterium]|jgi:uncharacterized membrane-anchored protein YitT (DUF2179 family)|nr:YitT family protein [Clostridiales bacterium]
MLAAVITKLKRKLLLRQFLLMSVGSIIYAAAIAFFLDPNRLMAGGVTGISIIISHLVSWVQTGTVIIVLNIPLFALGFWKFGRNFIFYTVYATLLSSLAMNFFSSCFAAYLPLTDDLLLASLVGGALVAVGLGLVFLAGGTTGGSDILIKIIRIKYRHMKTSSIFLIVDSIIIAASAIVFRNIELALYSAVVLVVSSRVLDLVLYGPDGAKLVYIISDRPEEIADRLMRQLDVGVTFLEGEGAYTRKNKKVLMCASRKQVFPKIRAIVTEIDEMAFMIVSSAQEIFGEGFKNYKSMDF